MTKPTRQDDMQKIAGEVAEYLYSLSDDCPKELRQPIDMLRQLINEEFVAKDKQISSQIIWDILKEGEWQPLTLKQDWELK